MYVYNLRRDASLPSIPGQSLPKLLKHQII